MQIAKGFRLVVAAFLFAEANANRCLPDSFYDVLRYPCTGHQRRRSPSTRRLTQTRIDFDNVGNVIYGYLTVLIRRYRTRHVIPEKVIQRTNAVPVFEDPREVGGRDLEAIGQAVAVYFMELQMMQMTETRLRVDLYESRTFGRLIRICQRALVSLLCRLETRLLQDGSSGFHNLNITSLDEAGCPETHYVEYMAKSILTMENMREYFRLMTMI